jgi:hypothetical protein
MTTTKENTQNNIAYDGLFIDNLNLKKANDKNELMTMLNTIQKMQSQINSLIKKAKPLLKGIATKNSDGNLIVSTKELLLTIELSNRIKKVVPKEIIEEYGVDTMSEVAKYIITSKK